MEVDDDRSLPFWFDEKKPGASDSELDRAEEYVGRRLPAALRTLLRLRNGGVSNYAAYEREGLYLPFLPVFGVDAEPAAGTVMRAFDAREEFGVPNDVVPFAGQGHSWWGLDYRQNGEPRVIFRADEGSSIQKVAESFEEFLLGLAED